MAKRTGKDLAFMLNSVAVTVARGWDFEHTDVDVDVTAAGDTMMDRASLRGDYTVNYNALLEIASPYVLNGNAVGTLVPWAAELVASDAAGIVSGTGKISRFRIEAAYDGAVQISGTIQAAGTALLYDLTPLT